MLCRVDLIKFVICKDSILSITDINWPQWRKLNSYYSITKFSDSMIFKLEKILKIIIQFYLFRSYSMIFIQCYCKISIFAPYSGKQNSLPRKYPMKLKIFPEILWWRYLIMIQFLSKIFFWHNIVFVWSQL